MPIPTKQDDQNAGIETKAPTAQELDKLAMAGFEHGVAVADGTAEPKAGDPDAITDVDDDDADAIGTHREDGEEEEQVLDDEGKPVVDPKAEKPAAKAAAAKPTKPGEAVDDKAGKVAPDAAVEKEIKDLGITNPKTQARIRELSADSKAYNEIKPLLPLLEKAGIKGAEDVDHLVNEAAKAQQWHDNVAATGATPEQYKNALSIIFAMNSTNPELLNLAFDSLQMNLVDLGKRLGRPVMGGGYDPLDADPALKELVEKGDMPRKEAERLVAAEAGRKLSVEGAAATDKKTQFNTALQKGINDVKELAAELAVADKDNYQAKLAYLRPSIKLIQDNKPPSEWKAAIHQLYLATPAPPKAAATTKHPSPVRPTGAATHHVTTKATTGLEGFERGLAIAEGHKDF